MALFRLTRRNVATLKRSLLDTLPAVRSAHADEAIAAGIGFNTHAALLAALKAQGSAAKVTVLLDEKALADRLSQLANSSVEPSAVVRAVASAFLLEAFQLQARGAANQN